MGSLFFRTFVPEMRRLKQKRRIAAWALLLVFVPMMVLVSLHHHSYQEVATTCVQCENHLPHAGHFSVQPVSHGDCVVCQFITLPYLLPSAFVFCSFITLTTADVNWAPRYVPTVSVGHHLSRAPPVTF